MKPQDVASSRECVDEHAKLKTNCKPSSQANHEPQAPHACHESHGDQHKSHGSQMNPTRDPTKTIGLRDPTRSEGSHKHTMNPTRDHTKIIGLRDPRRSEGSHKHTECNRRRPTIGWNLRSSHNFNIISEPNVLIWLR